MLYDLYMFNGKSIAISRIPYVTRQEKDKTIRAEADVCLPLYDLCKGSQGWLANELEIALANNLNMRKEEQEKREKAKKAEKAEKSLKTGEAITPANDKENKTQPFKKRARAK